MIQALVIDKVIIPKSSLYSLAYFRQLVSSYDGKFGHVHYYVKAVMERPSQPAVECKKYFAVEEPVDVNTPDLMVSH